MTCDQVWQIAAKEWELTTNAEIVGLNRHLRSCDACRDRVRAVIEPWYMTVSDEERDELMAECIERAESVKRDPEAMAEARRQ